MTNDTQPKKFTILFLCTGNSCRSQLAEAIVNSRFSDEWKAFSAGTKPTGSVHPLTMEVLEEIGIHHQGRSKDVTEYFDVDFDIVMTVCDTAQEECPVWLKPGYQTHYSFPDPAKADGVHDEILAAFRQVRDEIQIQVTYILNDYLTNQMD